MKVEVRSDTGLHSSYKCCNLIMGKVIFDIILEAIICEWDSEVTGLMRIEGCGEENETEQGREFNNTQPP